MLLDDPIPQKDGTLLIVGQPRKNAVKFAEDHGVKLVLMEDNNK